MKYNPDMPLIVQGDRRILLETHHPRFAEVRDQVSQFAELEKSPDYMHTYRISPLSLWNAAASGMSADQIVEMLHTYSKFEIPGKIEQEIHDYVGRYGLFQLHPAEKNLLKLVCRDDDLLTRLLEYPSIRDFFEKTDGPPYFVRAGYRGEIKQEFMKLGYPIEDLAGYQEGDYLPIALRDRLQDGTPFSLRSYQEEAVRAFYSDGSVHGGSGVLVLPCGAGKTVIGIAVMAKLQCATLILTTNNTSVHQWIREIVDKTDLSEEEIGMYTGDKKEVRPVTVATYHILTHRDSADGQFSHMAIFNQKNWGLIIYDEVHLLPAPVFRATAGIQAKRRLGLTATLIREDRREKEVFSLVGPKKYEAPWKKVESEGFIARASCMEIRTPMDPEWREKYAETPVRNKYQIASANPRKLDVLEQLLIKHRHDQVIIIGQYLDQLKEISERFRIPLITGNVKQKEREKLYQQFKQGEFRVLAVSKVANFAVDLPDASVAIQISGTFGSRQEEAQRLGRILRPKKRDNRAFFYTIVSRDTRDQEYALKRQLFLVEQGYHYDIMDAEKLTQSEWL